MPVMFEEDQFTLHHLLADDDAAFDAFVLSQIAA
jgi:hypothetical protein